VFVPLLRATLPSDGPALVIAVRGSRVAFADIHEPAITSHEDGLFLGVLAGRHCWAIDADNTEGDVVFELDFGSAPDFADLMALWGSLDEQSWVLAGRAVQLVEWARTHRFCGRCGSPTNEAPGERALRCRSCGLQAFPRLAPAIITLVERDDGRVLLGRNARWPTAMYSCLAGFVEPGETLEEAVRREVHEEVGVRVGELLYRRSQPWPFPHSLMVGFNARYESGEIQCDDDEIADAHWFAPDELPSVPGPMSIARWLIDDWIARTT
jgi:NAD+ diphosphatase